MRPLTNALATKLSVLGVGSFLCARLAMAADLPSGSVSMGKGRYATVLRDGGEREPPPVLPAADARTPGPIPTNQWYSSLFFSPWAQPLYSLPLSYRPQAEGWQIDVPQPIPVLNGVRDENDIVAMHHARLQVRPTAFPLRHGRAGRIGDWSLDVVMGDGDDALTATVVRGSPFGYYTITRGSVEVEAAEPSERFHRSPDGRTLGIIVQGKAFALFAPSHCRWNDGRSPAHWVLDPEPGSSGCGYFSIAAVPDTSKKSIEAFRRFAFAFVRETKVEWHYDERRSEVITRFVATTEAMEGSERRALLGLLPHHHSALRGDKAKAEGHVFDSIRGPIRLFAGREFTTASVFHGLLPWWPALKDGNGAGRLHALLAADMQFGAEQVLGNRGTYWEGKGLNRAAQLMCIAEQSGAAADRDGLLDAIKARLQTWFAPEQNAPRYFHYNSSVGSMIGYPDEYGSATELNDHHFHYGYWIFAAAQVALRDPDWAARENWGGMVELLIDDIAAPRATAMFPKLRHFDAYEGHSWASGIAPFFDGNNQESSSEAINAWAALILWGEGTGNRRIRDTGIYLYTTEVQSANQYWFDIPQGVFKPEYSNALASIVWGSKYAHATWFTDEPRKTLGVNLLPITTASIYLGAEPDRVVRNLKATVAEFDRFVARGGRASRDVWQDILLSYLALSDPRKALAQWDSAGSVEDGETRTHTYFWLQSLAELGLPRFDVTADTALFGVFRQDDGTTTYLAYNAGTQSRRVRFSDGTALEVAPRSMGHKLIRRKPS